MRVATTVNANEGITSSVKSLPLHATTNVRVQCINRNIKIFLNGTEDSSTTLGANRISGAAFLYVSDPWYPPALAHVEDIIMTAT